MALTEEDLAWVEAQLATAPPLTQQQIDIVARFCAATPDEEVAS